MLRLKPVSFSSRFFIFILLMLCLGLLPTTGVYAAGTVTGIVFRDYNANGTQDIREPGIGGATITGFDAVNTNLGTVFTAANGAYTYNWGTADTTIRLEFGAPLGFQPGANGGMSNTTVQFVTNGQVANVGFNRPGEFCQQNPDLALNCFQFGAQTTGTRDVLIRFGYNNGAAAPPWSAGVDSGPQTDLSFDNQIGTTWGLAHQAMTDTIFVGAFMKRHSGFGPGGPGAIYMVDPAAPPNGTVFTTLNAGADPHTVMFPLVDTLSWDAVGKIGLGDIDLLEDDQTMFVVNLFDQQVYQIAVNIVAGNPTLGTMQNFAFPANPCTVPTDLRPFGLGVRDGLVYVGVVCSAESTQNPADLVAHIFTLTPGVGISAAPVLSFPLTYPHGCTIRNGSFPAGVPLPNPPPPAPANCAPGAWRPWTPTFPTPAQFGPSQPLPGFGDIEPFEFTYPQPMVTGIEFDFNGDMMIGLRDRFGDQQGFFAPQPNGSGTFSADVAGDLLRACLVGGVWVLENAGNCGALSSGDAGSQQGPGGAEFYYGDNYPFHDETNQGGILFVPGEAEIVTTGYDPVFSQAEPFDGGVFWMSNTTGNRTQAYRIFDGPDSGFNQDFFGKGGSLGDLDAICVAAPIEIGNRVWLDSDADGRQSPNETPLAGVTVELYGPGGVLIATAVTDANGNYLFSNAPGASTGSSVYGVNGLTFLTAGYEVRIPLGQPALAGYNPTTPNTSANLEDTRDSDGVTAGSLVLTTFNTGAAGANNHTYDFGFLQGVPPTPTPPPPPAGGTTGGGSGGTNPVVVINPNPPFSQPGGRVTWEITIINPTNNPMPNVSFTKVEPNNITIISISTSGGTAIINGQVVTFVIDSIGPNQTVTITLVTEIEGDTPVPFIITNTVILGAPYSGRASASVISASLLPATGFSALWLWLAFIGGSAAISLLVLRRRRRSTA